jgi:hypothetical protein
VSCSRCWARTATATCPVGFGTPWLVPAPRGWVLLRPDEPDVPQTLGLAAGLSSYHRKRAALVLWRQHDQCGYWLCQRGGWVDAHGWNSPWEMIGDDPDLAAWLEPPHGDAALLADAVGRSGDNMLLRALLRRRGDPRELLAELIRLLGLPDETLPLLEGRPPAHRFPWAQRVERTSFGRVLWSEIRQLPPAVLRWTMYCAVVAAAGLGVVTLVGLGVLATNGALVDQAGVATDDIVSTIVFAILFAGCVYVALACRRRLRR